jgi:hypothetical protein
MSIQRSMNGISQSLAKYSQWLEEVSDDEFLKTPAPGVWSYSEVYSHIFRSNILCFPALEKCAKGEATEDGKSLKLLYRLILSLRSFPPNMRFKVPESLMHMVEKLSRDDARKLMQEFRDGINKSAELAQKASPNQKFRHPRLGLLNSEQWMAFIDTHSRHHLKQLRRIRKMMH